MSECYIFLMVMVWERKYHCDNECFLIWFFGHFLDLSCHFGGRKELEKAHHN